MNAPIFKDNTNNIIIINTKCHRASLGDGHSTKAFFDTTFPSEH